MKHLIRKILESGRRLLVQTALWVRRTFNQDQRVIERARVHWDDTVSLTLSNLAQEAETRASGRVQVISLVDFRAAIGDLWDKYQNKILIIAESTIARMIGKGNTFIPQGEDSWLLLFPALDGENSEQRADAIAANIGNKLVGAQFTSHEIPLPTAAKLDLTGALNADGSFNMEAVKAAISRVRQSQISRVVAEQRAKAASAQPQSAAAKPVQRSTADQLKSFYRPAWCAETQNIDSFFFRAFTDSSVNVYSDTAPSVSDATIVDLIKSASSAFTAMCDGGLQAKLALPIPFSTLQGPALPDVQRIIANLRQRDRLMYLRIEIVRIPPAATSEMLVPLREIFRAYVREVAFVVDLASPNLHVLVLDHIMLGVELGAESIGSDDQIFQEMLMFRQRAGRRGTYILGLHRRIHMMHAVRAGFSEIGGPALQEDTRRPPLHVTHMTREALLAP